MRYLVLMATLAASACAAQERAIPGLWQVETLDGEAFPARAQLDLSQPGKISGRAPCNGFSGPQTGALPELEVGPLMATRMGCADGDGEALFFKRLGAMTSAKVEGDRLILSDGAGGGMVLVPTQP